MNERWSDRAAVRTAMDERWCDGRDGLDRCRRPGTGRVVAAESRAERQGDRRMRGGVGRGRQGDGQGRGELGQGRQGDGRSQAALGRERRAVRWPADAGRRGPSRARSAALDYRRSPERARLSSGQARCGAPRARGLSSAAARTARPRPSTSTQGELVRQRPQPVAISCALEHGRRCELEARANPSTERGPDSAARLRPCARRRGTRACAR